MKSYSRQFKLMFRVADDMEWQELKDNGKGLDFLEKYARIYRSKGFDVELSEVIATIVKTKIDF